MKPNLEILTEAELAAELQAFGAADWMDQVAIRAQWANLMSDSSPQELSELLDTTMLGRYWVAIGMAVRDDINDKYTPVVFRDPNGAGEVCVMSDGPMSPGAWLELRDMGWSPGADPTELRVAAWRKSQGLNACRICGAATPDDLCFMHATTPSQRRQLDRLADDALRRGMRDES